MLKTIIDALAYAVFVLIALFIRFARGSPVNDTAEEHTGRVLLKIASRQGYKQLANLFGLLALAAAINLVVKSIQARQLLSFYDSTGLFFFAAVLIFSIAFSRARDCLICEHGLVLRKDRSRPFIYWEHVLSYKRQNENSFTVTVWYSATRKDKVTIMHKPEQAPAIDAEMLKHLPA